ncbi:MAG: hypothetical protein ACI9MC_002332 [Kiritimatiellia bacterium]|jgi:hypothetical protein
MVRVASSTRNPVSVAVKRVGSNLDLDSIVRDLGRGQVGLSRAAAVSKAIVGR